MAPTARDRVWSAALRAANEQAGRWRGFQLHHVKDRMDDPPSDKTIQRTLRAMYELGWLDHREHSQFWSPGEQLERVQQ